jgi:hypothetical protein
MKEVRTCLETENGFIVFQRVNLVKKRFVKFS